MASLTKVLKLVLLFCAITTPSQAFTIPNDQADGVYYYDSSTDTHTLANTTNTTNTTTSQPTAWDLSNSTTFRQKSPNTKAVCGNTIVASLDYNSAVQLFQTSCTGQTIAKGTNMYAKYGDAMVFMCTYKKNPCTWSDATLYYGDVNTQCGETTYGYTTGYVRRDSGLSYGLATAQESAC